MEEQEQEARSQNHRSLNTDIIHAPKYFRSTEMGMKRKGRIPLLDLGQFHSNRSLFVEELRDACHRVGFFLIRHDFQDVADSMLQQTRKFMSRPLEEKNLISYEKSPSFRGYMPLGVENTQGKLDSREQIEWAVEYPRVGKRYPWYERLKDTNPWPDNIQPDLRQSTLAFTKRACHVAECIRDALCLALGLDKQQQSAFISNFEDRPDTNELAHWVVKLISYPPVSDSSSSQGVGAHTDTNFLTLVLQDTVGGLQAFSNGEWVDVPTQYGSSVLVCNLGEQAQLLSRGYLLATPHRVLANTSGQARISVPLYLCLFSTTPAFRPALNRYPCLHSAILIGKGPKTIKGGNGKTMPCSLASEKIHSRV